MAQFRLQEIVGNHRVEDFAAERDAVVLQHHQVVLDVLPYLEDFLVLVDGFKFVNYILGFFTVARNGDVEGLIFFHTEAQTDQLGLDGIRSGGLRVQTEKIFCNE